MIDDAAAFKEWLSTATSYSQASIGDVCSRMGRADSILAWNGDPAYLFYLEQKEDFKNLTMCVKSQVRKAVRLYSEYKNSERK